MGIVQRISSDQSTGAGLDPDASIGRKIEAGQTLPSNWYTDDAIFEFEKRAIFRRSWEFVGHRAQVARTGDFFTCEVGGVPIVVVCGKDEVVRGFVNICRHRLHPVAVGAGNRALLQCLYHAWTYKLDGSFNGAPRTKDDPNFNGSELCLKPVAVDSVGDMIFVNPSADAPPLAEVMGPIVRLARERGFPIDEAKFVRCQSVEFDSNWKIAWDNNRECYHCPTVHSSWAKTAKLDAKHLYSYPVGPFHFEVVMDQHEGVKLDHSYYCWPAFYFMSPGGAGKLSKDRHEVADEVTKHDGYVLFRFVPISTRQTRLEVHAFSTETLSEQQLDEWFDIMLTIINEDRDVCRHVQKVHESGVGELGTLVTGIDSEYMTLIWERLIHRALAHPEQDLYAPMMEPTETWPTVAPQTASPLPA